MLFGGMKKVVAQHNNALPSTKPWYKLSFERKNNVLKHETLRFTRNRRGLASLRHGCMTLAGQVPATDHKTLYHTRDIPIERFGYLSDFEKKYEIGDMIGSGTFGKVCLRETVASGLLVLLRNGCGWPFRCSKHETISNYEANILCYRFIRPKKLKLVICTL